MARGWESKNIESQQSEAERERDTGPRERPAIDRQRTLELARASLVERMTRAPDGPLRTALEQAVQEIDRELQDAI